MRASVAAPPSQIADNMESGEAVKVIQQLSDKEEVSVSCTF